MLNYYPFIIISDRKTMFFSRALRAVDHPYLHGKGGRMENNTQKMQVSMILQVHASKYFPLVSMILQAHASEYFPLKASMTIYSLTFYMN